VGRQVRRSLSLSRLPPEDAVIVSFDFAGLMPASETFSGRASRAVVHPETAGSRVPSALASCAARGSFDGFTLGGPVSMPAVQDGSPVTLMQACTSNVHVPSAAPSLSQLAPSVHEAVIAEKATKQSVEAGPPPGTQDGHSANAAPWSARRTRTIGR